MMIKHMTQNFVIRLWEAVS